MGASLTEATLCIPFILFLFLAIADLGYILFQYMEVDREIRKETRRATIAYNNCVQVSPLKQNYSVEYPDTDSEPHQNVVAIQAYEEDIDCLACNFFGKTATLSYDHTVLSPVDIEPGACD